MEKLCSLCSVLLQCVEFNLRTMKTKISNTPLISLIEKVVGAFHNSHSNICLNCYNLINELDTIELRQKEIHRQLLKYVECNESKAYNVNEAITENSISDNIRCSIISDITDIIPVISNNTKNNLSNESHQSTDLQCENESIHSKLPRVIKDIYTNENKPLEITSEPNIQKQRRGKRKNDTNCFVKPHKCHCSKVFRTSWELKNHMQSHSDFRPFICDICGLSYKYQIAFSRHMDMHNGISPFTCVYCNKSFTQKGALVRHAPLHTGEKPYQCDVCGKRFVHHTSFNMHRLSHTGEKSYKCNTCGLGLMSASHLKRHMRIHTGEKKFACNTCGKRFAERYNLAAHEKLHSNPKSPLSVNLHLRKQIIGKEMQTKRLNDKEILKTK